MTESAYYGIGYANPRETTNYRTQARNMALREIAEKIFVSIDATSELEVNYEEEKISYVLNEKIEVASSNFLSGYVKVDDWISRKKRDYYVIFRLDKRDYLATRDNYFRELDEVIDVMISEADDLFEQDQLSRGINKLSEAVLRIDQETRGLIESQYFRHLEKRRLALIYRIERQLSRLQFNVADEYELDITDPDPLTIMDYLIDAGTGEPVHHIKAKLEVSQGDVFKHRFDRNSEHDALLIHGIFPVKGVAKMRIKLDPDLPETVIKSIDDAVLARLNSPRFNINFKPYSVYIRDVSQVPSPLKAYLTTVVTDIGLSIDRQNPHFIIEIDARYFTEQKGFRFNYQGTFDGRVEIKSAPGALADFNYRLAKRVAYADNARDARYRAYLESMDGSDDFLVKLVSYLCSKQP